jgi:hypothetical protein
MATCRERLAIRRRAGTVRDGSAYTTPGSRPISWSARDETGRTNVIVRSCRWATPNIWSRMTSRESSVKVPTIIMAAEKAMPTNHRSARTGWRDR